MPSANLIEARTRVDGALAIAESEYQTALSIFELERIPPVDEEDLADARSELTEASGPRRALLIAQDRLARTT